MKVALQCLSALMLAQKLDNTCDAAGAYDRIATATQQRICIH